jgi:hypothetical protein
MKYFPRTTGALHRLMFNLSLMASAVMFQGASSLLAVAERHQKKGYYRDRLFGVHPPATGGVYFEDEPFFYDGPPAADVEAHRAMFTALTGQHPGVGKTQWLEAGDDYLASIAEQAEKEGRELFQANLQELKKRGVEDYVTNRLTPRQAQALVEHEKVHEMLRQLYEHHAFDNIDPIHPDYFDVPPCNPEK